MVLIPRKSFSPFDPFRDFFDEDSAGQLMMQGTDLAMDVYEQEGNVVAEMNLPGIDPDDVNVNLDGQRLTISGEYSDESEDTDKQYSYRQRRYGSFTRSVRLPAQVDDEDTTADYTDGVLKVTMPKREPEEATGRTIEVNRS